METQIIDLDSGAVRRIASEVPELWGVTLVSLNDDRWLGYDLRTAADPSSVSWSGRVVDVGTLEAVELSWDVDWLPMFLEYEGSPSDLVLLEQPGPHEWDSLSIHVLDAHDMSWTTIRPVQHGLRTRGVLPAVVGDYILIGGDKKAGDRIAQYPDGEMITVVQIWSRANAEERAELVCEVETGSPHLVSSPLTGRDLMITDTRSQGWSVVSLNDCQPLFNLPEARHAQRLVVLRDNGFVAGSNRLAWFDPRSGTFWTCDATDGSQPASARLSKQEAIAVEEQGFWIGQVGGRWAVILMLESQDGIDLTGLALDDLTRSETLSLKTRAVRQVGTGAVALVREKAMEVRDLALAWPATTDHD
jgi:hypothetical protein